VDGGKLERIDNAKKFTENEMINFHIKFAWIFTENVAQIAYTISFNSQ
jgi:hypothetical protein